MDHSVSRAAIGTIIILALLWPLAAAADMQPMSKQEMQNVSAQAGIMLAGVPKAQLEVLKEQHDQEAVPQVLNTASSMLNMVDELRQKAQSGTVEVSIEQGPNHWTDEPVNAVHIQAKNVLIEGNSHHGPTPQGMAMDQSLKSVDADMGPVNGSATGGLLSQGFKVYRKSPARTEVSGDVWIWAQ
ncbi:MAG: hypothetical protein ACOC43_06190 [Desulfohalobiaceae bacterium]